MKHDCTVSHTVYFDVQFSLNNTPMAMWGDIIGWTYEGDVSPISMSYDATQNGFISETSGLPSVGSIVSFVQDLNLEFSAATLCKSS